MSPGRILTTHAGSLPRPKGLDRLWIARSRGEAVDEVDLGAAVEAATADSLAAQAAAGIDVANDGEQPRESFFTHLRHRLSGFGGTSNRPTMRDIVAFPSFLELRLPDFSRDMVSLLQAPAAIGPVEHLGTAPLDGDVDRLLRLAAPHGFAGLFMTAPSPGIVAAAMTNRHYASDEEYLDALATALAPEYRRIVERGLILQIDAPDLAMERHTLFADRPLEEFLRFVRRVVAALGRALAGLPAERIRLHVCWGNYEGPHHLDVPLADILPALLELRVGAIVLSMANPRHAHEVRELAVLPPHLGIVAGVIDTTTNYVEHPEVVADRIERAAAAIGDPERVQAGTDCGFATAAGLGEVAPEVAWEKLRSLAAGAAIASRRLF